MAKYTIVIVGSDGTVSVCGVFRSEYEATITANKIETIESGRTADVHEIERVLDVLTEISELG